MRIFSLLGDRCSRWFDRKVGVIFLAVMVCIASPIPAEAVTKRAFVGCWRNKIADHAAGRIFNLCFGPDELTIFIWTPSGGSDYAVYNWTLIHNSTIRIGDTRCKYQNQSGDLRMENCQFSGEFLKG